MGHKCWGIFDDKCDTVNLMLVDGYIDVDESRLCRNRFAVRGYAFVEVGQWGWQQNGFRFMQRLHA